MSYQIIWEERGCYVRYFGHVDDEELARVRKECYGDTRFEDVLYILNDLRECESLSTSPLHLNQRAIGDMFAKILNDKLKVAVVTDNPDILKFADSYKHAAADAYEIQVFASLDEARHWSRTLA